MGARYNANGDSGRFEEMLKVFADDAVMELVAPDGTVQRYEGLEQVRTIFTSTKAMWDAGAKELPRGPPCAPLHRHPSDRPGGRDARGRCYFMVLMGHGVDHWGRYIDEYGVRHDRWVITRRRALSDGSVAGGMTR